MSDTYLRFAPCHYYTFCYNPDNMFHWVIASLISCLLLSPAHASPRGDLFRHAKAATVLIMAINDSTQSVSMGSGFFVNNEGLLITNAHVVEESSRLFVYVENQFIHSTPEIIAVDADLDLAALKVAHTDVEILTLAHDLPSEGANVIAVGYPRITDILQMGFALHATVGTGTVSGVAQGRSRTNNQIAGFVQTTGILNFGNSGGPLVDTDSGEVAGMVVTTVPYLERAKDRSGAAIGSVSMKSGIGYSIPATVIRRWLESKSLVARPSPYRAAVAGVAGLEPEAHRSFATGHLLHMIALVFQHDADLLRLAVQHYETAVSLNSESAWMARNLGQAYAALGRWDEALEHYQTALERGSHDAALLSDAGVAWEHTGRQDRAADSYRAAIRIDARYAQAHNNLGHLLWKMGRTDEAIAEFQQALGVQPDLAVAVYNLGVALEVKGAPDEAVKVWETYLRKPPTTPDTQEWTKKIRNSLSRLRTISHSQSL
ncbi:MAG TPA: tetratricopeptide repeat-containing serine protease family protein, partial [Nitrospiraceae bacterium]|nr:tetratricopeptide repeat-containing serine protease family protein [Nitrospiraceae bacterium]